MVYLVCGGVGANYVPTPLALNSATLGRMSHLIPEVRVDKNGVPVTRHIKATKDISAGRKVPSPSSQSNGMSLKERTAIIDKLLSVANRPEFDFLHDNSLEDAKKIMSTYEDSSLRIIDERVLIDGVRISPVTIRANVGKIPEVRLREIMKYSQSLLDTDDIIIMRYYIKGLYHYPQFEGVEDFSQVDEKTEQSIGLLLYTSFMIHGSDKPEDQSSAAVVWDGECETNVPWLDNKELFDLIMDRPDQGGDLIELIDEHGSQNIGRIKAMLEESQAHALRDGVL